MLSRLKSLACCQNANKNEEDTKKSRTSKLKPIYRLFLFRRLHLIDSFSQKKQPFLTFD
jgi:hypothetical protein